MPFARIVLVKLHPADAHPNGRAALAASVRTALGTDPDLLALHVELPADADAERSWDLALRFESLSREAFSRLSERDPYRELFGRHLPAKAAVVKAWSFVPA